MKSVILRVAITFSFAPAAAEIVVDEIYGGGGKSSAPFNRDFIELFNNGPAPVDISGFQLKYRSPKGSLRTLAMIPGSTILGAGEFYVIGGASGAIGSTLPQVDFATFANLNATSGKVKLLDSSSSLVDSINYNVTADRRLKSMMSDQRIPNGLDTNNGNLDFQVHIPTPDAVNLAAVPEPSIWMMLSAGAAGLMGMKKLRRRRR